MSQQRSAASDPAVHLGQDEGESFRLGPLEIIVKTPRSSGVQVARGLWKRSADEAVALIEGADEGAV